MRVFIAPKIAGSLDAPFVSNGFRSARELQNVTMAQFGDDFAIEGYLHDVYRPR
jgi:riboflavin biosynthesis pyrimidine reductase